MEYVLIKKQQPREFLSNWNILDISQRFPPPSYSSLDWGTQAMEKKPIKTSSMLISQWPCEVKVMVMVQHPEIDIVWTNRTYQNREDWSYLFTPSRARLRHFGGIISSIHHICWGWSGFRLHLLGNGYRSLNVSTTMLLRNPNKETFPFLHSFHLLSTAPLWCMSLFLCASEDWHGFSHNELTQTIGSDK